MTDAMIIPPDNTEIVRGRDELPPLTPRQILWLEAYFRNGCVAHHATREMPGIAEGSVHGAAWHFLNHPAIKAHIAARMQLLGVTVDAVIMQLKQIAFAPPSSFMQVVVPETRDKHGNVVKPMIVREDRSSQIKALELLGKHVNAFPEHVKMDVSIVPKGFVLTKEEYDSL